MTVKTKKPKQKPAPTGAAIFKWRGGGFGGVPAQVVGEELARMEVKPGDYHKAPDILDEARAPGSPLHGAFEWDDSKAAESHRLNQARAMLRNIAVVITKGDKRVKSPVYVHITDVEGPRYVRAERVATDEDVRAQAMDEVLAQLNGLRRRFEFISELQPVFEAIDELNRRKRRRKG